MDSFSKFSSFTDAFSKKHHYQTKQAIKNWLPQVIVLKFEGQGLKNRSVIQKVLPRCKDLSARPLTSLPLPLNSLTHPFTSLPQVLHAQL